MNKDIEIRYVLSVRSIELLRFVSISAFNDDQFGRHLNDLIILLDVNMTEFENKPLTVAKIAQCIGMPRPTVARRVKLLINAGILKENESRQILRTSELIDRANKIMPQIKQSRILRNVSYVSKMDAEPVVITKNHN